jgi:hypothetical protein
MEGVAEISRGNPGRLADDSEQTASTLRGMHITISKDQTDATLLTVWAKSADDDRYADPAEAPEPAVGLVEVNPAVINAPFEPDIPFTPPRHEPGTVVNDGDLPSNTHFGTSAGATVLEAEIRQRLHGLPGLDFSGDGPNQQLIEYLIKSVARLSTENKLLRNAVLEAGQKPTTAQEAKSTDAAADVQTQSPDQPAKPISKVFHVVYCNSMRNYFYDQPRVFKGDLKSLDHLRGQQGIENITTYLDRNKNVAFAILNSYDCFCKGGTDYQRMVGYRDGKVLGDSPAAKPGSTFIQLNMSLRQALYRITEEHKDRFPGMEGMLWSYCDEPFLPFYIHNKTFLELCGASDLDDFDRESTLMICNWFEENHRTVWNETDELLTRGKITPKHFDRLFRPGELIVEPEPDTFGTTVASRVEPYTGKEDTSALAVERWIFSGSFQRVNTPINLSVMFKRGGEAVTQADREVDITDLRFYPLRFAKPGLRDQLIARGNRFWRSRKKTLISYDDPDLETKEGEKPVRIFLSYLPDTQSGCLTALIISG